MNVLNATAMTVSGLEGGAVTTNELKMEKGFVTGTERPVWDWTAGNLAKPASLHLEPSFKEELGVVFLCLKRGDVQLGTWLPREVVDSLRAGLAEIADYAEEED